MKVILFLAVAALANSVLAEKCHPLYGCPIDPGKCVKNPRACGVDSGKCGSRGCRPK